MYPVIYRMNKLANFIGKERDEYKLKASICAGITYKNNHSLQEVSSENCNTEDFLQQYLCLDNVNPTLCELLTQWKNYMNVLVCLLDDFYSSTGFANVNIMINHLRRLSNITKSKVLLSQLYMEVLGFTDSKTIYLHELRIINEILKIWSNISKHLKKIQSNLLNQLNSTNLNAQSEPSASDNSSDPFDEQFTSSKTIVSGIFDLSFFDSFLFYDQLNEYTRDTRRHSCGSLHFHKPKSALKKSNDTSTSPDKMSIPNETEKTLCEPVYIMNKSLMKCLTQSLLLTLQDYTNHLQFGCDPIVINIMNSNKTYLTQCGNNLNTEYYNCLNILLQTPVFATSVHGQLFNPSDIGLSDFWCHKNQNILDEQFNSGFTTQNMLCSWNGAVGTGAGLPMPKIYISKSLQTFIAFNLEVLLPMILNLLQVDINDRQSESQLHNLLYSEDSSYKPADSLNETQSSDNLNDDSLHLLVFELTNILVTILNGHGLNKSSEDLGADNSTSSKINRSSHDTSEFIGLTAQLSTITLSVDWDLNGIEKLALCVSDCLSLRALCSLLATIFQNKNEFSVKSNKFDDKDNVTSLFLGCVKEYDVSIRLLSEQITDICLVYYYKIGFTIEEDLNYFNDWKLLLLPYQFKLQLNQSTSNSQLDIEHLSKPIQSIWFILSNMWSILIQTCPAGLTRQIMAHVSSKILESAIQQLHVSKMNPSLDYSTQFRDELWFILGIAKFALYRSAETISEVLGIGNLTVELNTIHTTALLATQMLLSYYAPRDLWEKLHEEGLYSQMTKSNNKTFDFSLSNWLPAAEPTLFHDIPIHLILENCKLFCQTLLNYEEWPIWFIALIQLMAEPLERIWIRFKELKDQRLEEDESFHDDKLLDQLNENPKDVFMKYTPKRRAYWDTLFPSGQMPCGCLLPEPFSFNNIKHSHICTPNTTDVNRDSSNRSTTSSMKHQLKITSKLELEEEIGNYSNYYQKCGCSQEAWFELANDIVRLPVITCSPGLQLALTKINDNFMIKTEKESVEHLNNNNSYSLYGQHFAIHLVIIYLNYRIHEEIKTKLSNNEHESQQKPTIEQLQYSILLEYLQSLVNINEENEEIYACKNRVKSFLSERNDEGNDTESFIPGNSSKIFKNVQNLRFVQEKALPDLFFMHEFLHANTIWIRELIRSQRDCYKNISIKTDPCFQLDEAFNSNANITLIDSIEEINWDKICCINVGLQEL
ncbi:hypothetical protein KSF78_0006156 [Schistosoma japonicum]|nr:hypothetical protein KSF78_0006156 [Schistosoma japonicum]